MKAYSLDLRPRVLSTALRDDRTIPEVAALFGVSMTFVNKMLRLHRAGEDLAPGPHGGEHAPRLQARHHKLLRDLHALDVMSSEIPVALAIVMQASKELRDDELLAVCIYLDEQNKRQQAWLMIQIEHRAPHSLVVPQ